MVWFHNAKTSQEKKAKLEVFRISYPPEVCVWYVYIIIPRIMYVSYKRQEMFINIIIIISLACLLLL